MAGLARPDSGLRRARVAATPLMRLYYEEFGLIGPSARDPRSGHRWYHAHDTDNRQALACPRAMGAGIEEARNQASRLLGNARTSERSDFCCTTLSGPMASDRPSMCSRPTGAPQRSFGMLVAAERSRPKR